MSSTNTDVDNHKYYNCIQHIITGAETMYLQTGRIAQAAADPLADEFTSCMEVLMFPSKKRRKSQM